MSMLCRFMIFFLMIELLVYGGSSFIGICSVVVIFTFEVLYYFITVAVSWFIDISLDRSSVLLEKGGAWKGNHLPSSYYCIERSNVNLTII